VQLGRLDFTPVTEALQLVGAPVAEHLRGNGGDGVWVSTIDATLADTANFCAHYDIDVGASANCVVVEAKRADRVWYAACLVLATTRADVNGVVRKHLDARRISFAPMATAVSLTGMEYGGITPIGLPAGWPILVDEQVLTRDRVVIGSGLRTSKLLADTALLAALPHAEVLAIGQ
jgi:prolyl-tRNA editing enzyme YbaK/EbsC (Cys-tRNA(Pro) deacylase)